jgi:hypothetical protein
MHDNPFAERERRRGDPPGSVPGTGLGRQVGSAEAPPGSGWSLANAGATWAFAALAGMVVLVGVAVWLLVVVLG